MYTTIEIDFDVFKELTMRRKTPEMTNNEVVREALGLDPTSRRVGSLNGIERSDGRPWVSKGVVFPHGTEFRATYKGQVYRAKVEEGALMYDGKRFTSPSPAAMAITGTQINGWPFWECKMPGSQRWTPIARLRE